MTTQVTRLGNGLRYAIMPNQTPPGRVSLRLSIGAGSLMEADDQRGLAHFLEHMAFKGSENLAPGDLVRYMQRAGLAFGADTNAATGFDTTTYRLDLPRNDADQLTVQAIVQIARGLGKRTIAEFVEDEPTAALLREFGVDMAQGYHLGRPVDATQALVTSRANSSKASR